jgi:transposase
VPIDGHVPEYALGNHTIFRNVIRVWDEDARAADLVQQYEARIAALERLVGKRRWNSSF